MRYDITWTWAGSFIEHLYRQPIIHGKILSTLQKPEIPENPRKSQKIPEYWSLSPWNPFTFHVFTQTQQPFSPFFIHTSHPPLAINTAAALELTLYVSSSLRKDQQALNTNGGTLLKETVVPRRDMMVVMMPSLVLSHLDSSLSGNNQVMAVTPTAGLFKEYMDTFDGYSFFYPKNWIQVRGSGADVFFRDSFVLDENLSVEISSPSSSDYKSVEDLGLLENAGERVQKQNLIEFMSTRLGIRRESNILSTSSRVADDGKLYYDVEVNVKSYANSNELSVMPQERITSLEWDRRYLSVLGVENKRLYELRLQIPEGVFVREQANLRSVMDSFRVFKKMD